MATRSTLTVTVEGADIHFYRHWDGGLWGSGLTIARALRPAPGRIATAAEFLATIQASDDYQPTRHATEHSDREHHYAVSFGVAGGFVVHSCRTMIADEMADRFCGTWRTFREYVAGYMVNELRPNLRRHRYLRIVHRSIGQRLALRAAAPIRATCDQDATIGLPLFDKADQPDMFG